MPLMVDQNTVLAALGVTHTTLKTWMGRQIDPLPAIRGGRGRQNQYDLGACVAWLVRQKVAEVTHDEDGPLDYNLERAKLTKAQRIHTELQSEVLCGNLIPKDDVVTGVGRLVSAARSRLRSIPTQFAAVAVSMTEPEIEHALTISIDAALDGLAGGGITPLETAAETDGEPVGGPEPAVEPRGKRRARKLEH
jgi:phage terminase Nu1 subunit (DNA packaging protein)